LLLASSFQSTELSALWQDLHAQQLLKKSRLDYLLTVDSTLCIIKEPAAQGNSSAQKRQRHILGLLSVLLLIILIFAAVRLTAFATAGSDELRLHIGNQQVVTLVRRQRSAYRYPDLPGDP